MQAVALGPEDVVPGRAFTAIEHNPGDIANMHMMLDDLRAVLAEAAEEGRTVAPMSRFAWKVSGRTHRLIVCNEGRLRSHPSLSAVGFFGLRHTHLDIAALEAANTAVVEEFPDNPGILSYSSMELGEGQWGNVVLHEEPEDVERWRAGETHARAVRELSPIHYVCVRIHNAALTRGLFADPEVAITRTKYYDYSGDEEWQAVRTLAAGAADR
jgi:hypothetical protein